MSLEHLREKIDEIDYQIHDLLNERAKLALQIGRIKYEKDGEKTVFFRPEREEEILEAVSDYNNGPLSDETVAEIFQFILRCCLNLQEKHYKNNEQP